MRFRRNSDAPGPPCLLGEPAFSRRATFVIGQKGRGTYPTWAAGKAAGAVTINSGQFVNAVIRFVIVAFAIFVLGKEVNRLYRAKPVEPAAPPAPPREEILLTEIRDLLKQSAR